MPRAAKEQRQAAERREAIIAELHGRARNPKEQERFITLLLARLARDFARGELLVCEDLLNQARQAVEDPRAPCVEVDQIPLPREARAKDQAEYLQNLARARAIYGRRKAAKPLKAKRKKGRK